MPVKLIAVDMDGTFLNSEKKYNKARFLEQYAQLRQRGIKFVAASGNPLYTLQAYFPEIAHEIAFVAENGVYVTDQNQEIHYSAYAPDTLERMVRDLESEYGSSVILCAKSCAYVRSDVSQKILDKLNIYFKSIQQVDSLLDVKEPIGKVTLTTVEHDFETMEQYLNQQDYVQNQLTKAVSSGFGFIDLIIPNKHKAFGLSFLQKKWGIADDAMLTIGDNNNDIEMVQKAGYGFAMQNAIPALKKVAKFHARSNEEEGVLDVIDLVLQSKGFSEDLFCEPEAMS